MTTGSIILQENFDDFFLQRSMLIENPPGFHFTWPFAAWLLSMHGTDLVTVTAVTSVKEPHGPPETYPTSVISVIWSLIGISKRLSLTIPGLGRSPGERNGTHSIILAWRIPWTEESLVDYSPWGHKELDTTEWLTLSLSYQNLTNRSFIKVIFKWNSKPDR